MQQVTALAIGSGTPSVPRRAMDIAEDWRYDSRVGAKHDVGLLGTHPGVRLVGIELRGEMPKDLFSVIFDREACQSVQVEYECHRRG
jgi:hypothetical protein